MPDMDTPCPSEQKLGDFNLGKLPASDLLVIHEHLDACARCRKKIEEQPEDSFVKRLRKAAPPALNTDRPDGALPGDPDRDQQGGDSPGQPLSHEAKTKPPQSDEEYVPSIEGPGTRIGPYRLVKILGEGGMGAVYLAEQEQPIRRQVALKIIRRGMDSASIVARFEAERQALTLMSHPNIARVLDAGTTRMGLPYFVMELVEGNPITRYCDDNTLSLRTACSSSRPSARPSSTRTPRGSSTATSNRPTCWWPFRTANRWPR